MLNFNLAVTLVVAIWVILIAAFVIWYLIARRNRRRAAQDTAPGPRRHGGTAAGSTPSGSIPVGHASLGPASAGGQREPLGPDATQPVERLRGGPTPPPAHNAGPELFGLTTQREYERLAAEPFEAPPAAALGRERQSERFSWAEASQSGPTRPAPKPRAHAAAEAPEEDAAVPEAAAPAASPPAGPTPRQEPPRRSEPTAAVHKATGITDRPVSQVEDDLERTVIVPRGVVTQPGGSGWSLELPDGDLLPLGTDCIVGRRPEPIGDAATLVIADPTRTLSKTHARLRFDGAKWFVTDLNSTNGLWLLLPNGSEEEAPVNVEVEATERLRLGTLEVVIHREEDPA